MVDARGKKFLACGLETGAAGFIYAAQVCLH